MEGMKDEGGVEHPLSPSEEYLDAELLPSSIQAINIYEY